MSVLQFRERNSFSMALGPTEISIWNNSIRVELTFRLFISSISQQSLFPIATFTFYQYFLHDMASLGWFGLLSLKIIQTYVRSCSNSN